MASRVLWSAGDGWADFKTLLAGEGSGPVSFVTINRTLYVVNAAEGWYRRSTQQGWNTWASDNQERCLLAIAAATPCGLRMRWGRGIGEFTSTTPVITVIAGDLTELDTDELPEIDWNNWSITDHPNEDCGTLNCENRVVIVTIGAEDTPPH